MGQTCGVADPSQWMKTFGIDIDSRDTAELIETAKATTEMEVWEVWQKIRHKFREAPAIDDLAKRSIGLYVAIKKLMAKYQFDYYTIQSFPGLADDYTASCFAQSMILDEGIPTSTLSDFNTALTSILITYLSKERTYYGDFQNIDKSSNEIKIIGDGAVPPSLADSHGARFAQHGIPTEGGAGGLSVELVCKEGKGVLSRICRVDGKFVLVVVRCHVTIPKEEDIMKRRRECGIPFWPHAFVTVDGDIDALIQHWDSEYACLGYGDELYGQLVAFAELTGISCVAL
jgi:L-fucose isomerase-like protein